MAQPRWTAFLVVVGLLTIAVLALTRQSQRLVRDQRLDDDSDDGELGNDEVEEAGKKHGPIADDSGETRGSIADDSGGIRGSAPETVGGIRGPIVDYSGEISGPIADRPGVRGRPTPEIELTTGMLLANVAVTQGIVAAVVLAAAWYFSIPADALGVTSAPWSTGMPAVGIGAGFGVALWIGNELSTTIADVVGAAYDERLREMLAPDSAIGWVALLVVVLPIIAVSEEVLFRAALIGVPAAGFDVSPWLLAIVSSVAFAIGHGAQGRVGVVVTGALGFVLAAGYVVSGSLLLVVVAHYVINALEFLVHELFDVHWLENASSP